MLNIASVTAKQVAVLTLSMKAKGFKLPGSNQRWVFKAGAKEKLALIVATVVAVALVASNPWDGQIHTTFINDVEYVMTK